MRKFFGKFLFCMLVTMLTIFSCYRQTPLNTNFKAEISLGLTL